MSFHCHCCPDSHERFGPSTLAFPSTSKHERNYLHNQVTCGIHTQISVRVLQILSCVFANQQSQRSSILSCMPFSQHAGYPWLSHIFVPLLTITVQIITYQHVRTEPKFQEQAGKPGSSTGFESRQHKAEMCFTNLNCISQVIYPRVRMSTETELQRIGNVELEY